MTKGLHALAHLLVLSLDHLIKCLLLSWGQDRADLLVVFVAVGLHLLHHLLSVGRTGLSASSCGAALGIPSATGAVAALSVTCLSTGPGSALRRACLTAWATHLPKELLPLVVLGFEDGIQLLGLVGIKLQIFDQLVSPLLLPLFRSHALELTGLSLALTLALGSRALTLPLTLGALGFGDDGRCGKERRREHQENFLRHGVTLL